MNEITLDCFARVSGNEVTEIPRDLFVPPDALQVVLESFEGPLDFLLYLIRKQNFDILDIPITKITQQYMDYISLMKAMRLELAAEYMLMAAWLAEIKSRLLLPKVSTNEEEEEDPRAELVRRLQEYELFSNAANKIAEMSICGRDTLLCGINDNSEEIKVYKPLCQSDILVSMLNVMQRQYILSDHQVYVESVSMRQKMAYILDIISCDFTDFTCFLCKNEGYLGVVVTFIALLELVKENLIEVNQVNVFDKIYVRKKAD